MEEIRKHELIQFFDKFVQDFRYFDGALIASRYWVPYTAIHSDKSVSLHNEHRDIEQYFAAILADYKAQGVEYCTYSDFDYTALGNGAVLATMDWNMMKGDGMLITSWRESYILVWNKETWKIVTSVDH